MEELKPEERIIVINQCKDCPYLRWHGYHGECIKDYDDQLTIHGSDCKKVHKKCALNTRPTHNVEAVIEEFRKEFEDYIKGYPVERIFVRTEKIESFIRTHIKGVDNEK